jgi:hypothetical protein
MQYNRTSEKIMWFCSIRKDFGRLDNQLCIRQAGEKELITSQDRITELTTRQMYVDSSLIVKLSAKNGYFDYNVWAWIVQDGIHKKILVISGKYAGQDPLDLCELALKELGVKKIKIGVPQL